MGQNRESYHDNKIKFCKGIYENKMANSLTKVVAKKATHLPPRIDLTISDLKNANTQTTVDKWARGWANS